MNAEWEIAMENVTFRKARKQHRCGGGHNGERNTPCRTPIMPGEQYVEYVGEVPLFQSGDRYHHECAAQQGLIRRKSALIEEIPAPGISDRELYGIHEQPDFEPRY